MREFVLFSVLLLLNPSQGYDVYHPSFLSEDEMSHVSDLVRKERDEQGGPCNDDSLMNYLADIQVINPESIIKLATLNDIEPQCSIVAANLDKIRKYMKTCTPSSQADLYQQLIKGVEKLHEKLCKNSEFKTKFEPIHKCLHELRNDLENCEGPADWNENSDNAAVCKAYKDIADCYYIKTAKVCGKNAAVTVKELLECIIDSILTINCSGMKSNPVVKDAMPEAYIKKTSKGSVAVVSMKLILALGVINLFQFYTNTFTYY